MKFAYIDDTYFDSSGRAVLHHIPSRYIILEYYTPET